MRWVRVETENGPSYGIIDGDIVSLVKNCLFDDIEFTRAVIKDVSQKYCIDMDSIHMSGISNGGMFLYYAGEY